MSVEEKELVKESSLRGRYQGICYVLKSSSKEAAVSEKLLYCEGNKDGVARWKLRCSITIPTMRTTYRFVNNITTPEGGTHLAGFRNALTKTFNDYARKNKLLKENETTVSGEDIREGLTAIISVKIEEPQFEGQTKQKLGNSEARGAVDSCGKQSS